MIKWTRLSPSNCSARELHKRVLTENNMLSVQEFAFSTSDEKLTTVCIRSTVCLYKVIISN